MKSKVLIVLLLIASLSLSAQIQKGAFMVEGGINLTGNWGYNSPLLPEGFGISFGTSDQLGKDYVTGNEQFITGGKSFRYSLSPRFGYSVFRNFLVGVDLKYLRNNYSSAPFKENDKSFERIKGYGFFTRKYFGAKKFTPFIEAEFGFWSFKYFDHSTSPGGGLYEYTDIMDFSYYAGSFGYSYSLNPKFKINLLAKLRHTKESQSNSPDYKTLNFDSALVLSFSYFLNRKSKE